MKLLRFNPSSWLLIIFILLSISHISCWELMEGEGLAGFSDVTMLPEDEAILNQGEIELNGEGRYVAKNELSLNKLLGEIELKKIPGKSNAELFIKGKPRAFGEILAEDNKIRIYEYNKVFELSKSIYSVEDDVVAVRANAEINPNNIVGKVSKGHLVVTLSEENGWYQVKVVEGTRVTYGWIEAKSLAPVVIGVSKEHNCEREMTGNYTFKNKTNNSYYIALYPKDMPLEWIGNPGLQNMGAITIRALETQTFYNIKSGYYNCNITTRTPDRRISSRVIQISVETCQTSIYDLE